MFLQELEKEFGQSKAVTSFAVSMFHAVPLLVGPVASALTDRYGCRNMTILGSVLASLGYFLSSFAPSLEVIYFTCGVVAGFGLSMPFSQVLLVHLVTWLVHWDHFCCHYSVGM